MLAIIFGYSKYYVDSLSENVKRGNRTKLENGWMPHHPPIGYLCDPETKHIKPDPERFLIVRRIWDAILTGNTSPLPNPHACQNRMGSKNEEDQTPRR